MDREFAPRAFDIPEPFNKEVPLCDTHFWAWAREQPRSKVTIEHYLESLGFRVGYDYLDKGCFDLLDTMVKHFHYVEPYLPPFRKFSDAFTPAEAEDPYGYYVQGKPGRWKANPKVVQALVAAGWIYEISPATTYFAVTGNRLWARYQTIIGSRPVAEIIDLEA